MTAILAKKESDRIDLFTDGAFYHEETGILTEVGRKVFCSQSVPLAVSGRGDCVAVASILAAIVATADELGSFDETMVWLSQQLAERAGSTAVLGIEVLITGFSEANGPVLLLFRSMRGVDEFEPWVLMDMGEAIGLGPVPDFLPGAFDGLEFSEAGPFMMQAMRMIPSSDPKRPEMPAVYGVGGFIEHAVITRAGMTIERVHEWPDVIGQPITPLLTAASLHKRFSRDTFSVFLSGAGAQ